VDDHPSERRLELAGRGGALIHLGWCVAILLGLAIGAVSCGGDSQSSPVASATPATPTPTPIVTPTAIPTAAAIQTIAQTYADNAVANGSAVGVEVGVVFGSNPPVFASAGYAVNDSSGQQPFSPAAVFQLGSVTKVFTTNVLGQEVATGAASLNDPLSSFESAIGPLQQLTSQVTLEELSDFTGGFPRYAPRCGTTPTPGCRKSVRPDINTYTAQDFALFWQNAVPMNFFIFPPTPVSVLPAPYNYSDYAIGLLGLLIGDQQKSPLDNTALTGWFDILSTDLLQPLAMNSTYLFGAQGLVAAGYSPALASATVSNGAIAAIKVVSRGGLYSSAPVVTITGGGGTGATADAALDAKGGVASFAVTQPGSGYLAPASVTFNGAGATTIARAAVVIKNGSVVAVSILNGGAGYFTVPSVTITGGNGPTGTNATAIAHIANGQVAYVQVTNGGSGYVPPLAVLVAPGNAAINTIPIWAPAGALSSSMNDMVTFAAAALGHQTIGTINVPALITQGFAIAEKPYACQAENPSLTACTPPTLKSALTWAINPADTANGVGEIISKNGSLNGFNTEVLLMPSRDMAVVVFVNSQGTFAATGKKIGAASDIAHNVLYGLFYSLP